MPLTWENKVITKKKNTTTTRFSSVRIDNPTSCHKVCLKSGLNITYKNSILCMFLIFYRYLLFCISCSSLESMMRMVKQSLFVSQREVVLLGL